MSDLDCATQTPVARTPVAPGTVAGHFVFSYESRVPDLRGLIWSPNGLPGRNPGVAASIAENGPRYGNRHARRRPTRRQPEAILHAAWQSVTSACDRNGDRFRVIYPGIPGGASGPDFKDAILEAPDGRKIRGNIEIHVHTRDWYTHGHHADSAYNGVAFHVAALATPGVEAQTASGAVIPLLLLNREDATQRAERETQGAVDPANERIGALDLSLEEAGDRRFLARSSGLE